MEHLSQFQNAVEEWKAAALTAVELEHRHSLEFSRELLTAEGTEAARKARATLNTPEASLAAERAAIEARAKYQLMLFYKGLLLKQAVQEDAMQ